MGESGRSERVADAQVRRPKPGTGNAQKTQGDASPTVTASAAPAAASTAAVAGGLGDVTFSPTAIPLDLAPLDPARNGVLAALKRIERNTASSTRQAEGSEASTPALPSRGAGGRMAMPGSDNTSLRQQIYRIKRIERQVEGALPPAPLNRPALAASDSPASAEASEPSESPFKRHRETSAREAEADTVANKVIEKQGEATAAAEKVESDDQKTAPTSPEKPLTAEALRKLPLRDDSGKFLSRDEKAGMSQAELAQARERENRQDAKKEEKTNSLLGKLGAVAKDTLTNKGDATDGVGTAVGNAYYSAAKEAYGAYEELAGEGSKSRELYKWARGHWDKRKAATDATVDTESSSTEVSSATHTDTRTSAENSAVDSSTVERQHEEVVQQANEAQAQKSAADRERQQQDNNHHDDLTEELEALAKTNEDGFEEVVEAVKRIPGGGGTSIIPTRNPFRRGGGAGGARGGAAGSASRGRVGRLWDRVRGRTPAPTGGAGAQPPANAGRMARMWQGAKGMLGIGAAGSALAAGGAGGVGGAGGGALNAVKGWGGKLLGGGSRLLGAAAAPITAALAYSGTKNELAERGDLTQAQKTTTAAATGVGAGGGALAGAGGGAMAGALAGSVVPVIGTGVGALVGGLIGGALGAWGGEKAGRAVGDAVAGTMDSVEEEARKALDEREARLERERPKERKWYNPVSWFSGSESRGTSNDSNYATSSMPGAGARAAQARANPNPGGDASLVERDDFGRVAEKYESSGLGVGTVSTGVDDPGGVSYGKHQLSSRAGTMQTFLNSNEGAAYREEFAGMQAGSDEFSAKYREVAERDAEGFADAQQAFIARTHYDPVANYAATQGMDIESEAIQEALYSQSVQHSGGGNRKIIDDAMSRVGPDASEDEVIDALYDARGDYASDYVQPSAGRERYAKEREDVRAISQANARESQEQGASEATAANEAQSPETGSLAAANTAQGGPPASIRAPEVATTSPEGQSQATVSSRPMTVAAALDYGINGVTSPVEPVLPSDPITAIDDRQAAKAFHPAPAPASPRSQARVSRRPAGESTPAQAANAGQSAPVSGNPALPREGTSAAGVGDIQIGFSDPVLTLMAMDRL